MRDRIVAEARKCLGTRYHHQGRVPGAGLDCSGLIVHVALKLNLGVSTWRNYSRQPDGASFSREIRRTLDWVPVGEPVGVGDVLCFWWRKPGYLNHVGFATDLGMIHSCEVTGKAERGGVIEHRIGGYWINRYMGAFRFRGLGPPKESEIVVVPAPEFPVVS